MSLEEMQEQVERYYIEMENELLMNIAKKLSIGKPMEIDKYDLSIGKHIEGSGGVNEWQLERLKELGGLTEENAKVIAKYSGKTKTEVEKIFERARQIGTGVDEEILSLGIKAGILNEINPILEDYKVKQILNSSIKEVLTTFNKQNNSLLTSAGDNYRQIVNKVSTEVMSGTKTTGKAMQEAVSELAQNGLTGFTAKNGAQWSPEAYTKMVLRTNTQNTINRVQEERMKLAGNDYVEISSHMGARPLCSEDQGKIFSLSDNTEPIEDGLGHSIKVYAWSSSSYGEPAGILGINCGHSRYAFVPSLSIHREVNFTKKENDEAYIEKQRQRQYERSIRNKKREIVMLKETGAEESYIKTKTKQLGNYKSEYLDFLNKTGRTRISTNEWIGNIDVTKMTTSDIRNINSYISSDSYKINDLLRRDNKLSKEYRIMKNNLNKTLSKVPEYKGNVVRVLEIEDIDEFIKDYQVDKPIKFKEFLSFSDKEGYNNTANVKLYVESRTGRDIRDYNKEESEILYKTDSRFIVKAIKRDNNNAVIYLEDINEK